MCIAPMNTPNDDEAPTADVPTMPAWRVGPCDFRARNDRSAEARWEAERGVPLSWGEAVVVWGFIVGVPALVVLAGVALAWGVLTS